MDLEKAGLVTKSICVFQGSQVQFPALRLGGSQLPVTPPSGNLMPSSSIHVPTAPHTYFRVLELQVYTSTCLSSYRFNSKEQGPCCHVMREGMPWKHPEASHTAHSMVEDVLLMRELRDRRCSAYAHLGLRDVIQGSGTSVNSTGKEDLLEVS